jgi:outer membrane protein OmpA-like peptidoglycan-associated protein
MRNQLVLLLAVACATPGKDTAIGAGGGAVAGAVVGGLVGGWKGAAIGAGAGAVVGGSVGNYLDKQEQELRQVAETRRTRDGILVKLNSELLFQTGSAVLRENAIDQLEKLGAVLARYPADRIRIEGYTDSTGSNSVNEPLSERRAAEVKSVLVSRGVKETQMLALGFGDKNPIASNATPGGRARNRRVELHIDVPKQGSAGD